MQEVPENIWYNLTENHNSSCLDFSVNTNPLGLPAGVTQNFAAMVGLTKYYPDPQCTELRQLLAAKYQVDPGCILCGNGADDLLYRLVGAVKPRQALIIEPTFEEYERALKLTDCRVVHYRLATENDFEPDERLLAAVGPELDLVFLCNPNNPTGRVMSGRLLQLLLGKCRQEKVLLVADECFMEFLPEWPDLSLKQQAAALQNLFVLDAFTKTYALAGFRLGFGITGNLQLLAAMQQQGQQFAVSLPAQFAGICALRDQTYLPRTYVLLAAEREWLYNKLRASGLRVVPARANYLLCWSSIPRWRQLLERKNIKVRNCSGFYGLDDNYGRIAVRTHVENERLLSGLLEILKGDTC